jgi:hypothetical protein
VSALLALLFLVAQPAEGRPTAGDLRGADRAAPSTAATPPSGDAAAMPAGSPPPPAPARPGRAAPPAGGKAAAGVLAPAARGVPARIEAEEIRYSWTTRQVTVVGKPWVTLTREDMTLTCRRLAGLNDEKGQLARATCEGDVKLVRGTRIVTCQKATWDRDAARVTCEGDPVLRDGASEARGRLLTWDLDADEVRLKEAVQATVPADQLDLGAVKKAAPAPAAEARP